MKSRALIVVLLGLALAVFTVGAAGAGSSINAVWVHGNTAEVENPAAMESITQVGWGVHFEGKENTSNWIHIVVPAPVITENVRVSLYKVFVRFKTFGDAKVTKIHVWDGGTRVWFKEGLSVSGDNLNFTGWGVNAFQVDSDPSTAPNISMSTGLDIAVEVTFGARAPRSSELPVIQFSAAGADFYRSW